MGIADDAIVIEDRATRIEIRSCRLTDDIFHFLPEEACQVSISSFELLHKCLWHPSFFVMKLINDIFLLILLWIIVLFVSKQNRLV